MRSGLNSGLAGLGCPARTLRKIKSLFFPFLIFVSFLAFPLGILYIAREFDHNSGNIAKNNLGFYLKRNRVCGAIRCVRTIRAQKRPTFPKKSKAKKSVSAGQFTLKNSAFPASARGAMPPRATCPYLALRIRSALSLFLSLSSRSLPPFLPHRAIASGPRRHVRMAIA